MKIDLYDLACIRESVNLYSGGDLAVLENRKYFEKKHVEFSAGYYYGKYIIDFKGSDDIPDWIDNVKFCKTEDKIGKFKAHIHKGFDDQWDIISPIVEPLLTGVNDFIFSGHSLGGALATRAALDYIRKKKFDVITFGSPRVMDYVTAKYFNSGVQVSKRFVFENDVVPKLPTAFMNFYHVKGLKPLGKKNIWDRINIVGESEDHRIKNYIGAISKKILE